MASRSRRTPARAAAGRGPAAAGGARRLTEDAGAAGASTRTPARPAPRRQSRPAPGRTSALRPRNARPRRPAPGRPGAGRRRCRHAARPRQGRRRSGPAPAGAAGRARAGRTDRDHRPSARAAGHWRPGAAKPIRTQAQGTTTVKGERQQHREGFRPRGPPVRRRRRSRGADWVTSALAPDRGSRAPRRRSPTTGTSPSRPRVCVSPSSTRRDASRNCTPERPTA